MSPPRSLLAFRTPARCDLPRRPDSIRDSPRKCVLSRQAPRQTARLTIRPSSRMTPTAPVPSSSASSGSLAAIVLEIVSEKTGYPADVLELDMQLDADLGIDSIKRVEILSALQDRLPSLPSISPELLGTLRTLRSIVEQIDGARISENRKDRRPRRGRAHGR